MKLRECKSWKAVRLNDRTILKVDTKYMAKAQVEDLLNLEVLQDGNAGYYKVAELSTNLNRVRLAKDLSQGELAKLSGVSVRMIQKYEIAEKDINKAQALTVHKLAEALGVSVSDILEL